MCLSTAGWLCSRGSQSTFLCRSISSIIQPTERCGTPWTGHHYIAGLSLLLSKAKLAGNQQGGKHRRKRNTQQKPGKYNKITRNTTRKPRIQIKTTPTRNHGSVSPIVGWSPVQSVPIAFPIQWQGKAPALCTVKWMDDLMIWWCCCQYDVLQI